MELAVVVLMLVLGIVFISSVLAVVVWVLTLALRVVTGVFRAVAWVAGSLSQRARDVESERLESSPGSKEWGADWVD
ncbi:MAG: hypothetical protein LKI98_05470 [Bifidobacterium crudilactis]|jgi:hypothetical protein|nr:hypothetical protein [Bifidobacterium crudilactis]MCI1889871.1 hypothetical protein [Bifidobacterium crudilactis]